MKTLAQLRMEKGLTQQALADAIGISPSAIAMYETGKRLPSYRVLMKLSTYLDVPSESIRFGEAEERDTE